MLPHLPCENIVPASTGQLDTPHSRCVPPNELGSVAFVTLTHGCSAKGPASSLCCVLDSSFLCARRRLLTLRLRSGLRPASLGLGSPAPLTLRLVAPDTRGNDREAASRTLESIVSAW